MSRNKGARGEREFIAILQEAVDEVMGEDAPELKRNLFQTREGGADVAGMPEALDFMALEIKRQEALNIEAWWNQTLEQAAGTNRIPVLAYRQSRRKWRVIMTAVFTALDGDARVTYTLSSFARIEVSLEDFLNWFKHMLRGQNR